MNIPLSEKQRQSSNKIRRPEGLQENVPLNANLWFQTGGTARWYGEPTSGHEWQALISWARELGLSVDVIGEGSNLLLSDEGVAGLVIRPRCEAIWLTELSPEQTLLSVEAGASLDGTISRCLDKNLLGLEEFSGIPGTIGGAAFINVHYFQYLLSHFLVSATVIHALTGELQTVDHHWFNFGYNQTTLHERTHYLVDATFVLKKVDDRTAAHAQGRRAEIIRHRRQRYPYQRTCGSFFRNFLPHEVNVMSNGKKMTHVAYYMDQLGLKGTLSVGGASVSYQHANMIVTEAGATSSDVINLARLMQQKVHEAFGIMPQPECQFLGFSSYPLMR